MIKAQRRAPTVGRRRSEGVRAALVGVVSQLALPLCLSVFLGLFSGLAWAQDPAPSAGAPEGEYDFAWLDPEKRVYVLQNRKYRKADHVLVSVLAGRGLNNPYRTTTSLDARVAYYWSEAWGVEAMLSGIGNQQNNNFKALLASSANTRPVIRETKFEVAGLIHWVPWYAKINFFNQILYFDWLLQAGLGSVFGQVETRDLGRTPVFQFIDESRLAFYLGTGQQFHLSQSLSVRLEVMGTFFRAPLLGTTGDSTWISNYVFRAGVGLRL